MPTVGSMSWALLANSTGFGVGTAAARKHIQKLHDGLFGLRGAANVATTAFGALGVGLGGAAIVGGFKSMISDSMESIDRMGELSDRLGVATERLTGLGHAAQMNGSSAESMNDALDTLSKSIGTLSSRGGKNVEVLSRMGVDITKLSQLSPDKMFLELADAMTKLGSAQERAALAGMLKLDPDMVNVLMQGRDALEETIRSAEDLGIAFSRVDADAIGRANDAWDRMGNAIGGASNKIAVLLAPLIERTAAGIERVVTGTEDLAKQGRSQSQQDLIDEATAASWVQGMFLAANIDKQNEEFAWLQNLGNVPALTPEQIEEFNKPKTSIADRIADEKMLEAKQRADEKRQQSLLDRQLEMAREAQERQEKIYDDLAEQANSIFDRLRTPAERLGDEFLDLARMQEHLPRETFQRGLLDLQERAKALRGGGSVGAQSTAAIRAGSVDALRATFSGNVAEKTLKAAEKQVKEQERANALLERIEAKLPGLAEAPG